MTEYCMINEHKTEFSHELNPLKAEAILVIVHLFVVAVVSLNCVSTSVQAIVSILVRWTTQLSFYSVAVTSRHSHRILYAQKTIGENIRRHNDEKFRNMARIYGSTPRL